MRKRQFKIYAGMPVIKLFNMDITDLNLKEGDYVDIEDIIILKNKKEETKNECTTDNPRS